MEQEFSTQNSPVLGLRQSNIDMSELELVNEIQALAEEIENMDGASSGDTDLHRLSPGAKPTVLWAKRRFPRQAIRSTRKIGPQRKIGFGATARVAIASMAVRPCHYTQSWNWPRNENDNLPLTNPLSKTPSQLPRWNTSAASLSGNSECSLGTIAGPHERESFSDVEPDCPKLTSAHPLVLTIEKGNCENSLNAPTNEATSRLIPVQNMNNNNNNNMNNNNINENSVCSREVDKLSTKHSSDEQHEDSPIELKQIEKKNLKSRIKKSFIPKRVTPYSNERPEGKSTDSTSSRLNPPMRTKTKAGIKQLCDQCKEPLKREELAAKWDARDWDQFWTKVSCAASEIRLLREHGLEDGEACVDFLCSFKKLINLPFL